LHTLLLPTLLLIGVSLCEVLELVVSFPTCPSSLKMEFVCIFYCVFEFGSFTVLSFTSPYLVFYLLLLFGLYGLHWIDLSLRFFKKPKFAKIGVRTQKFSPFSSSQFFYRCKSDEHRDFHQGADFNPASPACTPGVPTQGPVRTGS
jgi:hypothetical protein